MKRTIIAALLCCTAAHAYADNNKVPVISGSYVQVHRQYCGATMVFSNGKQKLFPLSFTTGLATFDADNGTLIEQGWNETATLLPPPSPASVQTPENLSFSYTNTADTVTIVNSENSLTVVYNVIYGTVRNGVAQFFALIVTDPNGCARQVEYTAIGNGNTD